jgi:hypothetical protein
MAHCLAGSPLLKAIRELTLPIPQHLNTFKEKINVKKKVLTVGHWWLKPVILATQEAEIRRITV